MLREEEAKIIERVLGGDTDAFETLVIEYQKKTYNLALRLVGNAEDALDMTQEAFLRAYTSLSGFRGESKFSVWLYRLTSNVCIDFIRSRKRNASGSLSYLNDDDELSEMEIPDNRFSPETEYEKKCLRDSVAAGLEKLSLEYRQILAMREIGGLSYEEIGEALELEPGTVKSRIFRARKRLCNILIEDGNISPPPPSNKQKGV